MTCDPVVLTDEDLALRFGASGLTWKTQEPCSPLCPIRLVRSTHQHESTRYEHTIEDYDDDLEGYITKYGNGCFCLKPIPDTVSFGIDNLDKVIGTLPLTVVLTDNDNINNYFTQDFVITYHETGQWEYEFEGYILTMYFDRNKKLAFTLETPVETFNPPLVDFNYEDNYILFEEDNLSTIKLSSNDCKLVIVTGG